MMPYLAVAALLILPLAADRITDAQVRTHLEQRLKELNSDLAGEERGSPLVAKPQEFLVPVHEPASV